jgi:heme/copper-type cytochrome/quinol oxidase subunit 4
MIYCKESEEAGMIIVKYIFAALITIPILVFGMWLFSQYVDRTMSGKKKKNEGDGNE